MSRKDKAHKKPVEPMEEEGAVFSSDAASEPFAADKLVPAEVESSPEFGAQSESDGDDPFADIRSSLREEERQEKEEREKSFLGQLSSFIHSRREKSADEESDSTVQDDPLKTDEEKGFQSPSYESPDLSSWVVADTSENVEELVETPIPIPEIEPIQDIQPPLEEERPRKQTEAVRPKPILGEEVDFDAIRDVALENYEEAPSLTPSEKLEAAPVAQSIRAILNELRPLEKILIAGTLGMILVLAVGLFTMQWVQSRPAVEAGIPNPSGPYPVRVTLPGGWAFDLVKGSIVNETWSPTWAEWLEGTEICKWVALPWSMQLEAVVRSFESGDVIEVTMSNTDVLKYKVHSIERVPVAEIATLNQKTPSLLLILVNKDSDERWVVTALP